MRFELHEWVKEASKHRPLVVLISDKWDDYGYRTGFRASFLAQDGTQHSLGIVKILERGKKDTLLPRVFDTLPDRFASAGQGEQYYRVLADLGIAREVLTALRDLCVSAQARATFGDEGVETSLYRFREAEGASALGAGVFGRTSDSADASFSYNVQLKGFESPHSIDFPFSSVAPLGRLVTLVGSNGCGKTRLLAGLAEVLSGIDLERAGTITRLPPFFSGVVAISCSALDTFRIPKRFEIGSYRYIGLRNAAGTIDMPQVRDAVAHLILRRAVDPGYRRDLLLALEDLGMAINDNMRLLRRSSVPSAEQITQWLESLSAGEEIVIHVATQLIDCLESGKVVLFDEPELHLHPSLLAGTMRFLHRLIVERHSFAVVATHSPIPVQETPATHVRIIDSEGRHPSITKYEGQSFGENLGGIVAGVFRAPPSGTNWRRELLRLIEDRGIDEVETFLGPRMSLAVRLALDSCRGKTDPHVEP